MLKFPIIRLIGVCLLFFILNSCLQTTKPLLENSKYEPFDNFTFQRSFPDKALDQRAWKSMFEKAKMAAVAQRSPCDGNATPWLQEGPFNVAGRANTLAIKPTDENTILAGFSGGGIFKSTDGGVNWQAVFDNQAQLAIGDIVFDPINPNIVYAGTGDPQISSIPFNGNGIFKSTDSGETWQYLGLEQAGVISKIELNPTNTNEIYAATMGNPYQRTPERGIYKSINGGQTWQKVLHISDQAGACDLVMNPQNPLVLYASFWDRIRSNEETLAFGDHARVYKTTDGGVNWVQLGGGLPQQPMCRTGLAISNTNPDKVYAIFVDTTYNMGGVWKTVDGGTTWEELNTVGLHSAYGSFGWYFGKLRLNPANDEEVYVPAITLWKKAAGSTQWSISAGVHADVHDLIFTPSGKKYLGCDGGVYRNIPPQMPWIKSLNLPTTQLYHVSFNPHQPTAFYGGAQDNGIQKGSHLLPNGWTSVFSKDGFKACFHSQNPDIFWVETQNGEVHMTLDGGDSWMFGQEALGTSDRCNWDMPLFKSTHHADWLYAGTYRVYASQGSSSLSWGPISPDLTDGNIYGDRFHNISCVQESPISEGLLVAGTTDGNVWRRTTAGVWTNITGTLPERYVTSVSYSPTAVNRMFVTHSGIKYNEYVPHIHRSDNLGNSWTDISANMPQTPVNDLLVVPGFNDQVLIAATDVGVYYTLNGGDIWSRLGSNMPFIPVFDLELDPSQEKIAAATYARGCWTFPVDSLFNQQNAITVSIQGQIRKEDGSGKQAVQVGGPASVVSGLDGQYLFENLPGCSDYTITPYKNNDPTNGVSTLDLLLMNRHILGIDTITSPYKQIAADANKSGTITTFDIVALRKLILGIDTAFTGNTSWRFVDAEYVFPDPFNPFTAAIPESKTVSVQQYNFQNADFIACKIGDINDSATNFGGAEDRNGEWPLTFIDQKFAQGETVETDFGFADALPAAFQFELNFDSKILELSDIQPLYPGLASAHFYAANSGKVAVCFEPGLGAANGSIFRLKFRARQSGSLGAVLNLQSNRLTSLAYGNLTEKGKSVALRAQNPAEPGHFYAKGPTPNPVIAPQSTIIVGIPEAGEVLLEIIHYDGMPVFKMLYQKAAGEHVLPMWNQIFDRSGVYFYKVQFGGESRVGKFTVIK